MGFFFVLFSFFDKHINEPTCRFYYNKCYFNVQPFLKPWNQNCNFNNYFDSRRKKEECENKGPRCCFPDFHFISATFSAQLCMVATHGWWLSNRFAILANEGHKRLSNQSKAGWFWPRERRDTLWVEGKHGWSESWRIMFSLADD